MFSSPRRCVKELLKVICSYWGLFLMSLSLKRNHSLTFDPNQFKTQEMCEKAIEED